MIGGAFSRRLLAAGAARADSAVERATMALAARAAGLPGVTVSIAGASRSNALVNWMITASPTGNFAIFGASASFIRIRDRKAPIGVRTLPTACTHFGLPMPFCIVDAA